MKNVLFFIAVVVALGFSNSGWAQSSYSIVNFAPTLPMGNTADYIGVMTGRSVNVEFIRILEESRFGYGIEAGRSSFFEKIPNRILESGTVVASGTQFRYINTTPIIVSGHYFFTESGKLRPFASLGFGVVFQTRRVDMGIFSERTTGTQLAIRPELGTIFQISDYVGIKLSGKYYQTMGGSNLPSHAALGFNLGFVIIN
ncbi:hypothetical protein [Pararhodonellum marinum]|uniref:hypothetical protein n=1 Tax=Pararhodonellum marinum TaxID=2755358 RepID=UPI00188E1290|nr:hypothetical protein [Pararhodonellum marinum]